MSLRRVSSIASWSDAYVLHFRVCCALLHPLCAHGLMREVSDFGLCCFFMCWICATLQGMLLWVVAPVTYTWIAEESVGIQFVVVLEVLHVCYTTAWMYKCCNSCYYSVSYIVYIVEEVLHLHQKCRTKDAVCCNNCKIFILNWKKVSEDSKISFWAHVRQHGDWNYVTVLRKSPKFPRSSWILKKKLRFQWCVRCTIPNHWHVSSLSSYTPSTEAH